MKYPFLNLADANAPYLAEIQEAIARVAASGRYIGGEENQLFESNLSEMTAGAHIVAVSNGLDALRLMMRALVITGKLNKGDEVIVPANTYVATILAIIDAELTPVLAEPSPVTHNLDTDRLAEYLTPLTRAVMAVHLYGRPCFDSSLRDFCLSKNLLLLEDNAQAIGAVAETEGLNQSAITGSLGHAAAFSFYPTKNIGAMGDAGAVATFDSQLAAAVRALANYGSDRRYHNIYAGFNCRMDPIQAAVLNVKLAHLDDENRYRQRLADTYLFGIKNPLVTLPAELNQGRQVWHQFVIRSNNRDRLRRYLADNGVQTDIHYATPPHLQPALNHLPHAPLPITERLADEVISLPITRTTSPTQAEEIAAIINNYQ